jgi:hypothetical protein
MVEVALDFDKAVHNVVTSTIKTRYQSTELLACWHNADLQM